MRIYIDSADLSEIKEALASGFVYGVTTNPTLLRRAGVKAAAVPGLAKQAIAYGAKELHLQTYSDTVEGIVHEAVKLSELDLERVVVKIPATPIGYQAAAQLTLPGRGLRVTLTAVYTVRQAILAHAVGAHYIAAYLGRMRDQGLDALELVGRMQRALDVIDSQVEILAASVRAPEEIEALALLGVATATLPLKVLKQLPDSSATSAAADTFLEDAKAIR
jgi:transaldolase